MTELTDEVGRDRQRDQVISSSKRTVQHKSSADISTDMDQDARDDATRANMRMDSHERLCTERWTQSREASARIEVSLAEIRGAVNKRIGQVPATIISLLTGTVGLLGGFVLNGLHH